MMAVVRRIVFVVYSHFTALDLVGPHEVFGAASQLAPRPEYSLTIAAAAAGPVPSARGPVIVADTAIAAVRGPIDTLVVIGGEGTRRAIHDQKLVAAITRLARRARRVTSVCTGAFLLAEAGLLDGRRVTTHWSSCTALARRHPTVAVDPDPIFVRDGDVWTSAGVTAGMDLALALVADDLGRDVALATARQLVMYVQRPGSQAQFSAQLGTQVAQRDPIRELQAWIVDHPHEGLSVERLAARVAMSPRHFARVFRDEVGETPGAYVERVRLEVARRLLETTGLSVEDVAAGAGFGTVETMRRLFARRVGASPRAYRERFRPVPAS
jgi:transcriptional regulator GlxA family with amidase domain